MSNDMVFLNQDWFWSVMIGSALLLSVFVWKEWLNISKKRSFAKMVIAVIAVFSLALLALRPAFEKNLDKGRAVLLTEGYENDRLDSLVTAYKNLKIITYGKGKPLQRNLDSVSSLFILGNGPASFDFWQFKGIPTTYFEGNTPEGITRLKYSSENTIGSVLEISGRYDKPQNGNYVVLQAPGGLGIDSLALRDAAFQNFSLAADLKVKGNLVYGLTVKDSTGEIRSTEPLPIAITHRKPLKVLMINSFPTFESKYLKNYLAEMNHEVLVRSRLTKAKYKFEYFNRERTPIYGLSKENLKQFDILIIDATSYKNLSSISFAAITGSVMDDGLGIFIQPDASFFNLPKRKSRFDFTGTMSNAVTLEQLPKIEVDVFPYRFDAALESVPVQTLHGNTITAYKRMGRGRIATTVFRNTYQLVLDGNTRAYRQLWAATIAAVSARNESKAEWQSSQLFAVRNQPYDFVVRTSHDSPRVINRLGSAIPLNQNPDLEHLWYGKTYPRTNGWNQLMIEGDSASTYHFYVGDSTDWTSLVANQTIAANKRHFKDTIPEVKKTLVVEPLNPLWFFLIFLLCMGWLWLEPKLFGK